MRLKHCWLTLAILIAPPVGVASAQVAEFHDQSLFATSAGALTVVNFDSQAAGTVLTGNEFAGQGMTMTTTGGPINIVRNLVAGCYGPNFVTEANLNSGPNAISTSITAASASPDSVDEFDFILDPPVSAAGLYIGNLGNGSQSFLPTTVRFFDQFDAEIVTPSLGILADDHPAVIFGTACGGDLKWDNRIFYGIISTALIKKISVRNGPSDGDGITVDDVQFGRPALSDRITDLGAFIRASNLDLFNGPNANADAARRNALATRADEASASIAVGDIQGALDALRNLLSKVDGVMVPPDWMEPSPRKSLIATQTEALIDELMSM